MVTKVTVGLLATLTALAIFVTLVVNKLDTRDDYNNRFVVNQTVIQNDRNAQALNGEIDNLFWFVHMSDTHFSIYFDPKRVSDLENFCANTLPTIKPPVFVLTGDITDSRTQDPIGSDSYEQEWKYYEQVYNKCLEYNPKLTWLDIRGNHDNFNVLESVNPYYRKYTTQGRMGGKSYRYEYKAQDGNSYSFVGIDACLTPGVRRPFNFIGQLDEAELKRVRQLKEESKHSNYTVWFGHYPTSSIYDANQVREIFNGPYLCGHLHSVKGFPYRMFSTQPQGYLEAEIGDWRVNRFFRIAAIDGGLFTYEDFNYFTDNNIPLIVITNPRKVLHQMEHLEPYWRTARSTHIRALVFSNKTLTSVKAYISDQSAYSLSKEVEELDMRHVQGPLWVVEWDPQKYAKGLHYITVIAHDDDHNHNQVTNAFSLDQTKPPYSLVGRVLLRISFPYFGMTAFTFSVMISILPLVVLRLFTANDVAYSRQMYHLSRRSFLRKYVFKLYLVAHINKLFISLVFIPTYLAIGPWCFGLFVHDHYGMSFMWANWVDNTFLPVGFTYIFATIMMYFFYLPFFFGLSCLVYNRYVRLFNKNKASSSGAVDAPEKNSPNVVVVVASGCCDFFSLSLIVTIFVAIVQGIFSLVFYFAYGLMGIVFNVFFWASIFYLVLIWLAIRLKSQDFPGKSSEALSQDPSVINLVSNSHNNN